MKYTDLFNPVSLYAKKHRKQIKQALLYVGIALLLADATIALSALIPLEPLAHPMGATGAVSAAIADAIEA